MANSLKNISVLISPRFRSPLTSKRNLLGAPRSDGKVYYKKFNRLHSVKKLDFSENADHVSKVENEVLKSPNILPNIKIEEVFDKPHQKLDIFDEIISAEKTGKILDINSPNKLDLAENGLKNFKSATCVLGKGAFGTVFKGRHKGQIVAVKIVNKENSLKEENALHLNHKNIVKTLEIIRNYNHQNYCLIILEYIANCKNLQSVLEKFYVEHSDVLAGKCMGLFKKYCLDITAGLDYCHQNGILHLDLKPNNILVDSENVCKICDFGNSVKIEEDLNSFKHNGTVMYTAPEILLGKKPSVKSDIYSLGLIFWQIKYRRNPFQSYDSNESIIYNVGKFNIKPAYEDKSPDILTRIFTKCWQSDPELRPSASEILEDLKAADF